jgi:hypothetical protein
MSAFSLRIDAEEQRALYEATNPEQRNAHFHAPHPTLHLSGLFDSKSGRTGAPQPRSTLHSKDIWAVNCWCLPWCGCRPCSCWHTTPARLLLTLNAGAFVIHAVAALLTLTACGGTFPSNNANCKGEDMEVHIVRLRSQWNSSGADGYDVWLVDNGKPVRFDWLTGSFFLLSAGFHLAFVVVGSISAYDAWIWGALDAACAPWRCVSTPRHAPRPHDTPLTRTTYLSRYIEYSASASVMALAIALLVGIREQNNLAFIFGLHWTVMMLGLLTEVTSRPRDASEKDGHRYWEGDPQRATYRVDATLQWMHAVKSGGAPSNMGRGTASPPDAQRRQDQRDLSDYYRLRRWNYVRRMLPHVVGIFTYAFAWVPILWHFFQQLDDLRREDEDLFENVPDFVPWAVLGTFVTFSTFTFPQWYFQYASPDLYYVTEVVYVLLSLTSKLYLGGLMYSSVLVQASFAAALSTDDAG